MTRIGDVDRAVLLKIARNALTAYVESLPMPAPELGGEAARPVGAFVTLHVGDALRGCIGHLDTDEPLGHIIARCAVAAGSSDPRFPPVTASELGEVRIELSILGVFVPVARVDEIAIGRDGLVVERGAHRGLLLPQVASEYGWDVVTFVEQTCRKAGLPNDAWKNGAAIWRFEAEVFGESIAPSRRAT
jgi:AmmeMemoRadiSam system protein A